MIHIYSHEHFVEFIIYDPSNTFDRPTRYARASVLPPWVLPYLIFWPRLPEHELAPHRRVALISNMYTFLDNEALWSYHDDWDVAYVW
jgi:hypothetical protein